MTPRQIGFYFVVLLSNIVQCVTGFAGTVLAMPFSVMLVGMDIAKPVLNLLGFAASVWIVIRLHARVDKKTLLIMLGVSLPGMAVGALLRTLLAGAGTVLFKLLGTVVIVFAVMNGAMFLAKKEELPGQKFVGPVLLALGGVTHGLFVCGGPLLVTYASGRLKETDPFRATLSAVWIVLNGILAVTDIAAGCFTKEVLAVSAVSLAALAAAMFIGGAVARRLPKKAFLVLTYILMAISGVSLLLKS